MKNKDSLNLEVNKLLNEVQKINGHFSTSYDNLGNGRTGVDIFSVSIKKGKDGKEKIHLNSLYRRGVFKLLEHLGICFLNWHGQNLIVRIEDKIVSQIEIKDVKDIMIAYVKQLPILHVNIASTSETFSAEAQVELFLRQANLILNEKFLEYLKKEDLPFAKDDENSASFYYKNGIVKVEKTGAKLETYGIHTGGLIWEKRIIDFSITQIVEGQSEIEKFINNVSNHDPKRILALRSAIGYMLHSFQSKSGGQIVILYDESISDLDSPQGGTGKGIIANAISMMRLTTKMDGKKFTGNSPFDFQEITPDTEIIWLDDVKKQFDIDRFNSISTDGFNIEKKFKPTTFIPPEDSPKIIISSNVILNSLGSTRIRRQFIIELSNFYSSMIKNGVEEPIIQVHGCRFFTNDWDQDELNRFYWYMMECAQLYLRLGLLPVDKINVVENRLRQTIGEEMYNWIKSKDFQPDIKYDTKNEFKDYQNLYEAGNQKYVQRTFSNNLKSFFIHNNIEINFFHESIDGTKKSFFRIKN